MARYSTFLYSTDVYGAPMSFTGIDPVTGPSTGGTSYAITGTGFQFNEWDDTWEGGVLDPGLWTDISTNSGTITTGADRLILSTGTTANSIAGIETADMIPDSQFSFRVNLPRQTTFTSNPVKLITFESYIDASNYGRIFIEQTSNSLSLELKVEVVKNGSTVDSYTYPTAWTYGLTLFKILRFNEDLYFYANGSLIYRSKHYVINPSYYRIYSYNEGETYDVANINGESFFYTPFVVFGTQVDDDPVTVSGARIRGVTPPSIDSKDQSEAYAGLVDIHVVSSATLTSPDAFEYYYVDKLTLENNLQSNVKLSIIDDDNVVTPEASNVGLGGGQ